MSNSGKILVVGAGVAGPSVCYWLKKYGFSPVLIDNAPQLRTGGQPLDIRGVAVPLVKKIGIYEKICEKRTRVACGRYVDAQGNIQHEEKGETFGFRYGEEVEIVRGDLINILMNLIEGVPCYFNKVIVTIKQNDAGVDVHFKDGSTENYDLVIGADGIHSATRRAVFDKDDYKLVNLGAYYSIFTVPNYLKLSHTEVLFESDYKCVTMTSDEDPDSARVGFMFRSEHVLNNIRDKNEQMQFLRDIYQNLGWETNKLLDLMPHANDFYFDSITQVKMQSWMKGRVVLLGDAGYCATPFSGQGNNLAMVGAYILAGELKLAKGNYHAALKRYHELFYAFVQTNQDFGVWASETFLLSESASKEVALERSDSIMEKINQVSNGIKLPDYEA